ncbi:MAG TPA: SDR family NAD(P)-dependent oxidoreductase [Thermoanaerobaculia bacterium]|nr:SDR family NAD(P)-dependent oxidoreductase [Thermoanaerobaculia bacterium]
MRAIITGASSGIGAALARELSRRGWSLGLLARRADLLDELAGELKTPAVALAADVTDRDAVRDAVQRGAEALGGDFDLAVANAGISVPTWSTKFNVDDAERIIRVNVLGMFYLFDATIPAMLARGSGRFAGVASIAGLRGLPSASVYSASKAAMQAFLEASRVELTQRGVGVTIINPGWVETPIIEKYKGAVPFIVKADKAARIIADGLERGAREIEFPWQMSRLMRAMRLIPNALYDRMLRPYARRKIDPEKVRR